MSLSPGSTTEASAVVIPPYISVDPALWFHMLESTFDLATPKAISESKTKYNYVVAHLPPSTATMVRDIIMKPDTTDPYEELKAKIIERCGESRTLEIRKLLAGESLGDRKPTELLRLMKRRAENHNISDELLLELFTQQMPTPVQTIFASLDPITPEKAAEIADRILDLTPSNISVVSIPTPTSTPTPAAATVSAEARTPTTTEMLFKEIQELRKEVVELRRSRSAPRQGNHPRYRSKSRDKDSTICWYHTKFQHKANKCIPPCSFAGNRKREE